MRRDTFCKLIKLNKQFDKIMKCNTSSYTILIFNININILHYSRVNNTQKKN